MEFSGATIKRAVALRLNPARTELLLIRSAAPFAGQCGLTACYFRLQRRVHSFTNAVVRALLLREAALEPASSQVVTVGNARYGPAWSLSVHPAGHPDTAED